jgi:hypothetical protein
MGGRLPRVKVILVFDFIYSKISFASISQKVVMSLGSIPSEALWVNHMVFCSCDDLPIGTKVRAWAWVYVSKFSLLAISQKAGFEPTYSVNDLIARVVAFPLRYCA